MSTDWRSLAAELAAELERCRPLAEVPDCLARARAALAAEADGPAVQSREPASVVGEPSDEEIMELMPPHMHEDFAFAARAMANETGTDSQNAKGFMRIALNRHAVDLALAVLARWGRPAPAPAEGEVAGLVEFLRIYGDEVMDEYGDVGEHDQLTCAADLLERQAAPVPVAVSERLPGAEDCDAEGFCWRWNTIGGLWARQPLARSWYEFESHWLPATALPLPQGKVEK